jgi:pimeloyl-ACP methyl ester carboxylesterase
LNGITLPYVHGGQGPPLILIHGFPQDWFEYHAIMPRLAKRFTVIATDLRGVSGSTSTQGSYDAANMAEDVYQLVLTLKLERLYIVGHDIGGMVAYAFLRRYPEHPRGDDSRSSNSWNLNFGKFTQSEVVHSVQSYATPEQLNLAFEMYRPFSCQCAI